MTERKALRRCYD